MNALEKVWVSIDQPADDRFEALQGINYLKESSQKEFEFGSKGRFVIETRQRESNGRGFESWHGQG